jgi:hypothetical protein
MDLKVKKQIRLACVFQGVVWGLVLVTTAILSFIPNRQTGFFFEKIQFITGLAMFFTPLVGLFFFVLDVPGKLKKFIYAASYVLAVWILNLSAVGLIQVFKWESLSDKKSEEAAMANKPIYDKVISGFKKEGGN